MPQVELKAVQRELEQGLIWPFYWIYGPEKYKQREITQKIQTAVLGKTESALAWGEEVLEGGEVSVDEILDALQSPVLMGGPKLVIVRDAHLVKNPDALSALFGASLKRSDVASVCVCIAKDLDGRKKFSKSLVEKAAVIACDAVIESQKEAWIQFLAKRHKLELDLNSNLVMKLCALEPWSLDIVDQELEKFSLSEKESDVVLDQGSSFEASGGSDRFLECFFLKDLKGSLSILSTFANDPDQALPLLGLLGWNTRQIALLISDRMQGTRFAKINPYLADKLKRWSYQWTLSEISELQGELTHIDRSLKQTPLLPLGLWSDLVFRYCRN
jgi:DNA polymerase III delta subunit